MVSLKTIVSYIPSGWLIVLGGRVNLVPVILMRNKSLLVIFDWISNIVTVYLVDCSMSLYSYRYFFFLNILFIW